MSFRVFPSAIGLLFLVGSLVVSGSSLVWAGSNAPSQLPLPEAPPPRVKVVVFTSFDPDRLTGVFAELIKTSPIDIAFVTNEADLILGRLLREANTSSADLLLLPNAARLDRAAMAGLLQPVDVKELEQAVPASYRDPARRWFGLSSFARGIAVSVDRVKPNAITRYADLAQPEWKGRLCLPPLNRAGNRTLFASILFHDGRDKTSDWMRALADNAAPVPADPNARVDSDDRTLVEAIANGTCDAALVGSRTLARLVDTGQETDRKAAQAVRLIWPDEDRFGVSVDVVGVGMASASSQVAAVSKVLSYLSTDTAQRLLAEALWAYPIKAGVPLSNPVTRWGPFRGDPTALGDILPLIDEAGGLAERAGWK